MKRLAIAPLACLVLLGGCTVFTTFRRDPAQPQSTQQGPSRPAQEPPAPVQHSAEVLSIPPGHLPSPGQCRVWVPDTPPGQQRPPGRCSVLETEVPSGAWLVYRPESKANEVEVSVYRSRWPRSVSEIRYFDFWTGKLLRVEGGR